jgi:hypothetical protein
VIREIKVVSLENARKRLEQLGLPMPVITTDYEVVEEDDAPKSDST